MENQENCISCGNKLIEDIEVSLCFCDSCIEEAVKDYWSSVIEEAEE